jgi:acetyltransferase-like isoleucine patch superfamily enzyme
MGKLKQYLINHGMSEEREQGLGTMKYRFFQINWIKTLWFNFKALPLKEALRMPIIISWNVKVRSVGKITIEEPVTPGMISIGVIKIDPWETNEDQIIFCNEGHIIFGGRTKIHPGVRLTVFPNAELKLGERVLFGCKTRIVCSKSITLGHDVRFSWEGQLFDTDFHFLTNINTGHVSHRQRPVAIGDNVFIGNRCTIGKGTVIPNGSVISCCSKVSGNHSSEGENLLFVGNPAKVVGSGYSMGNSWYPESEVDLARKMGENE